MAPSSSRIGVAWATKKVCKNFKCPLCGSAVKSLWVRGSQSPQVECSNPLCRWAADQLIPESSILAEDQKPKAISSRQWYQAKATVAAGGEGR